MKPIETQLRKQAETVRKHQEHQMDLMKSKMLQMLSKQGVVIQDKDEEVKLPDKELDSLMS